MPYALIKPVSASALEDLAHVDESASAHDNAVRRLDECLDTLRANGIAGLTGLGTLTIAGTCVPVPGILTPDTRRAPQVVTLSGFRRWDPISRTLVPDAGAATMLVAAKPVVPVSAPYWAAEWIDLAAGTTVVLRWPQQHLLLIAERITIGTGVTFTWEQPLPATSPRVWRERPPTPLPPPVSDTMDGITGARGQDGLHGDPGSTGKDAPAIDLWGLDVTGHPVFDLRGQDGFPGGSGQDGGFGAAGSLGREAQGHDVFVTYVCDHGPGNGGDGGHGGSAGNGGAGGDGGHGGRLTLQAPRDTLLQLVSGFMVSVTGGAGGTGGIPGVPGDGGPGGERGANPHGCSTSHGNRGRAGRMGAYGSVGPAGARGGDWGTASTRLIPITAEEFRRKATDPAIVRLDPAFVREGEVVTLTALRLTAGDQVLIDAQAVAATVVSDALVTFTMPLLTGGRHAVAIRRADGRTSNSATVYVLPVVTGPAVPGSIRPGATVTLLGSGFAPGTRVRVNDQDMPNVAILGAGELTFTMRRPTVVAPDPAGEHVTLRVVLSDGTPSEGVECILETYRILAIGDSVMWGQGLQEQQKIPYQVADAIQQDSGGMHVYTTVLAHSGAIIGAHDTGIDPAIDGEVPTDRPTVSQQAAAAADEAATYDLVLVNGGINDVGVFTIVNPLTSTDDLRDAVRRAFETDLAALLERVLDTYPNAEVVVTGYYPILSTDSDLSLVRLLLLALGVPADVLLALPGATDIVSDTAIDRVLGNAATFADESRSRAEGAIAAVSETRPTRRIVLADPRYGSANAALASDPLLFGINADGSPQDNPAVSGPRAAACDLFADRTTGFTCPRASAGHPNPRGARRFVSAILEALDLKVLATPKQLAPPDGLVTTPSADITLTWDPTAHATRYLIEVEQVEPAGGAFVNLVRQEVAATSFDLRQVGTGQGRWRVTAQATGFHSSAASGWRRFDARPAALPAPRLLAPDDGASFDTFPRTTNLRWAAVPGAECYLVEVQYSAPPMWTFLAWLSDEVTDTSFTFDHLGCQPGRWRVTARAKGGATSPASGWRTFVYTS